MKSHVLLLARVLEDTETRCCTSTSRDLKTITTRLKHEGLSFLTITLPTFGKDFERSLDRELVTPELFSSFKRAKGSSLPAFLRGLTEQVFDRGTGVLLHNPSIEAIQSVRQISYLFSKIELPCSDARVKAAFAGYMECEQSVRDSRMDVTSPTMVAFRRISRLLFGEIFSIIDREVFDGTLVPKHGPGSTADRLSGNQKYQNRMWTERLESIFHASEFMFPSYRHYFDSIEDGCGPIWLEPGAEIPAKVITVPKTLKTPRIIAMEPSYMQYVQQALKERIYDLVECPTKALSRLIGFTDQSENRDLARKGSFSGDLATLDLSEASDRVSFQHVNEMTWDWAWLNAGLFACRSEKADVPGYGVIPLTKYASMGSALTFPLEAMVFLTIIFMSIEESLGTRLTNEDVNSFVGQVRVFGDDIVVPKDYVRSVVRNLEDFGLKVNVNKSFWTGKFRESCGGDFYDGYDVSVVRCRRELPTSRRHAPEIISAVSLRNQLYFAGYWRATEFLDNLIERFIPFPRVGENSPGLGRHSFLDVYDVERECPNLQRPLVKAAVESTVIPQSNLGDTDALLKYFLKRGDDPFADKKHLQRAGRPAVVNIKLRWVPSY